MGTKGSPQVETKYPRGSDGVVGGVCDHEATCQGRQIDAEEAPNELLSETPSSIQPPSRDTLYYVKERPDLMAWELGEPVATTEFGEMVNRSPPSPHPAMRFSDDKTLVCIKIFGHRCDDVARTLVNAITSPQTSQRRKAVDIFKRLRDSYDPSCDDDDDVLFDLYEIFDQIFFLGALRNLRTVEIVHHLRMDDALGTTTAANKGDQWNIFEDFACMIRIRRLPKSGCKSRKYKFANGRLGSYVETLIHEMLHAFFNIYTCRCEGCTNSSKDFDHFGNTGHGLPWHTAALAFERFASINLLPELAIGREKAFLREWHHLVELDNRTLSGIMDKLEITNHGWVSCLIEGRQRRCKRRWTLHTDDLRKLITVFEWELSHVFRKFRPRKSKRRKERLLWCLTKDAFSTVRVVCDGIEDVAESGYP